jgi:hypothetical protein
MSRVSSLRFAPLWLLASACHLVVSPSGDVESDEAGIEGRECGDRTCSEGNVCCNASCGICTAPGNVCIQIACEPMDEPATCKTVLCARDELCMETPAGAVCVPEEENPCNLVDCQPSRVCRIEQGAPVCAPLGGSADAGTSSESDAGAAPSDAGSPRRDAGEPSDAGTRLDATVPSEDGSVTPRDAAQPKDTGIVVPPLTCATVLCAAGTYCDDISGSPQCIPLPSCATVRCSAGYHCELEQVQCIRAPCPPLPTCVPNDTTDPCASVKCKAGTHCEVLPITCITAPCDPIAQCVPDRGGCGCSGKPGGGACLDIACPVAY